MAGCPSAVRCAPSGGCWMAKRPRAFLFLLVGVAMLLLACTGRGGPDAAIMAGKWKSTRLTTPLLLYPNGEWEIRSDDGTVLQYGVWRLEDRQLIWFNKSQSGLIRDANRIESFGPSHFELREADGSATRFDRLD